MPAPTSLIGRKSRAGRDAGITFPSAMRRSRVPPRLTGPNSATGRLRSVTTSRSPRSTRRRYLLKFWRSSATPTVSLMYTKVALRDRLLVHGEPDRRADRGDDPEAQDDLRLRPAEDLEVVVHRGHQEDPLAEGLEGEDLDEHAERLDDEDAAEDEQELLGLRHHRQAGDRAAEAERAGVAHEDGGREGVEPQKADARPDQAPRQQREVSIAAGD